MGIQNALRIFSFFALLCLAGTASAQSLLPAIPAPPQFPLQTTPGELSIVRDAVPSRPFSVVGQRGAVLGQQDGVSELWIFPWKILSDLRITAQMENYPVPIDVNQHAASINVRPDSTVMTFSHANFTVRETVLAPSHAAPGSGAQIFFQIESVRPMSLTFSFTPDMQRMWPAESDAPSAEWVATGAASGFYILHINAPDHAAAVAMPEAKAGILAPYQERAKFYPLQFVLRFDPHRDVKKIYPLLVAVADSQADASKDSFDQQLRAQAASLPLLCAENQAYYRALLADSMSIETPDKTLDEAFSWAEVSMEQLSVQTAGPHAETAYTAGFIGSGDSVRPGFGWFFGRDALWTLYAANSTGRFEAARKELEFLMRRQSADGKMPHEWSQSADQVDWKSLPYAYASADATPLLPMVMNDYLRSSGDQAFITAHWENLLKAWQFETAHDADGDGIYDNAQGTGWVESWIPAMPRQEIYLAVLDEQASLAFAHLAASAGHPDLAAQAQARAVKIAAQIEREYYLAKEDSYAFSWDGPHNVDANATIFPAVAWWDGDYALEKGHAIFSRWASEEFSTDWGTRLVSEKSALYDPISYHQGTVWPLFTGWVSLAEYRTGRTLSGYAHLIENARLTWAQDLGAHTELLSGQFYQPLGRSTAHQLWSSAMVISPTVRGLFGLQWDVAASTLSVTPHLPADWPAAAVRNLPFGEEKLNLKFTRTGTDLVVEAENAPAGLKLISGAAGAHLQAGKLHLPLPEVEVAYTPSAPVFGDATKQLKVLDQQYAKGRCELTLSGMSGSAYRMELRENAANLKLHAQGAVLGAVKNGLRSLDLSFHEGAGYQTKKVEISW
jgi:glycogen debranching enzyme